MAVINRHGITVPTNVEDFSFWANGASSAKFTRKPTLADVSIVQFRRGCTKLFWKTNMDSDDWEEGDFLKKKTASQLLRGDLSPSHCTPRGIP